MRSTRRPFTRCATALNASSIALRTHVVSPLDTTSIESFAAFVPLACIRVWIRFVHKT